jgi:type IV secretion system protein VirB6
MACPAIVTGEVFLTRVIAHVDCQAQVIGTYGYQALAQQGSPAGVVATVLLTVFVALFGLRLMFGPAPGMRDAVLDVLKIGIVLTLAFSWPAFRVLVYDVVVDAPAELASFIVNPLGDESRPLVGRLQAIDNGIVQLIDAGTGRSSGAPLGNASSGATFAGSALQEDAAFGWSRLLFLGSTIGTVGLLRLFAGLLLALSPLVAGLLLFEASRGLFAGWLRGLVLAMLGTLGASVVLSVQASVLEPWLTDALRVRALGYATPSTPLELFAISLAFAVLQLAMIAALSKVAFHKGWPSLPGVAMPEFPLGRAPLPQPALVLPSEAVPAGRAQRIADSVESLIQREERRDMQRQTIPAVSRLRGDIAASDGERPTPGPPPPGERLGDSFRRTDPRTSRVARNRDLGA